MKEIPSNVNLHIPDLKSSALQPVPPGGSLCALPDPPQQSLEARQSSFQSAPSIMNSCIKLQGCLSICSDSVEGFIDELEQGCTESFEIRTKQLVDQTTVLNQAMEEILTGRFQPPGKTSLHGRFLPPDRLPTTGVPPLPIKCHKRSSIMQVDGEFSCSESEDEQTFRCELITKVFSTNYILQKHIRQSCKLRSVEVAADRLRKGRFERKTYQSDKNLEPYINTCDNSYAKFMCCENKQNPITISNFWPCLFDYRGRSDLTSLVQDVCAHNSYEVLASILTDAHNFYNIHQINFPQQAYVEKDDKLLDISQYRVPKFWQNFVKNNRPTFTVEVLEGMVTISLSEEYLAFLGDPLYVPNVSDDIETSDDNESPLI